MHHRCSVLHDNQPVAGDDDLLRIEGIPDHIHGHVHLLDLLFNDPDSRISVHSKGKSFPLLIS